MEERDKKLGNLRQRSLLKSQLRVSVAASTSQYHHQRTFSQDHHHLHHLQPNLQTITHPAVIKTKAAAPLNLLSMVHFWSSFFSLSPAAAAASAAGDGGGGGGGGMGGRRYCQHTHTLDERARSDTPP